MHCGRWQHACKLATRIASAASVRLRRWSTRYRWRWHQWWQTVWLGLTLGLTLVFVFGSIAVFRSIAVLGLDCGNESILCAVVFVEKVVDVLDLIWVVL